MLASLVAIPFVGALLPPVLRSRLGLDPAIAAGIVTVVALAVLGILTAAPFQGETLIVSWPWLPSIGLDLAFRFDGLGMLFAYLIVGIGLLVIVYARYYLKPEDATGRFYAFLLLFMGAMLGGVVCALVARQAKGPKILAVAVLILGLAFAIPILTQSGATPAEPRPNALSMSEAMSNAQQPVWAALLNPLLGAIGVLIGAGLVAKRKAV